MIMRTTEKDFKLSLANRIFKSEPVVLCRTISPDKKLGFT